MQQIAKRLETELDNIPLGTLPGFKVDLFVPKSNKTGTVTMNVTPWTKK
ncbi:hypothetical protein R6242_03835 [Iodobacter sp. CM08]|nr:hypothetical protein [Iodobacter sp. CM08]MDW5415699.1 hypothetical protein [Iodobacter sp. CM08]